MAFPARFNGTCSVCGKEIIAKEHFITWSRKHRGRARHFDCDNVTRIPDDYRTVPAVEPANNPTNQPTNGNGESAELAAQLIGIVKKLAADSLSPEQVRQIVGEEVAELLAQPKLGETMSASKRAHKIRETREKFVAKRRV